MQFTLLQKLPAYGVTLLVMALIFVFYYFGFLTRTMRIKSNKLSEESSIGPIEGSLLGLMALMLSFTFSMSSNRYDQRMNTIFQEANAIGTAVLRADLYPDSIRKSFRSDFKKYVENRIAFYQSTRTMDDIFQNLHQRDSLQFDLWNRAATLGIDQQNFHRSSQMIPALNEMFDIVTTTNGYLTAKVPDFILYLLFLLCFACAYMLGYTVSKKPDWIIVFIFSVMISLSILMILDLDRPRRGLITSDVANEQIVQLRNMFGPGE